MDLKRLNHLVALFEERNFARAAERVHLSQPAFSRSVQAAEAELGLRLFDRGGAEVRATPAGEFVVERARKLVFESRCLDRDVSLYRQRLIGDVAFGMGPFPAATLLPGLLIELRRRFAGVNIQVEVNNWTYLLEHLRNEELDFFVADIRDVPRDSDLTLTPLGRQEGGFYCRAGHPLLKEKGLRIQALQPYGFASVRLPREVRATLGRLFGHPKGLLPAALECDDVATLKRVVMATDTILAATHAAVADEVAAGRLRPLPLRQLPPLYAEAGIVALTGRTYSPVAQFLVEHLEQLAEKAGRG
jgi:DNA-binding transcriptional LysR family regulator